MTSRSLTLENGLRCHLFHQADARDAAALMRVQAGSLDEPDRWPGLAHLLEHLLFCGSARFSDDQRLMPWVQQQDGQVNATTQLSLSAFFCQVPAPAFAAGIERLCDMLAAPSLTSSAIQQESAVIDAEFHLLRHHAETQSEAALLDGLGEHFRRFRIGNHAVFGDNVTDLQAALHNFHQRFYRSNNMQLWLQGPQSLDELEQLAVNFAGALRPEGQAPDAIEPQGDSGPDRLLQLSGDESFWLTFLLQDDEQFFSDVVTLLNCFWQDEAPGSLLAQLRSEALCEALDVQWLWRNARYGCLALRFSATRITPEMAARIEHLVWQHLAALGDSTEQQRQHYLALAQRDFAARSPLEQLRGRALSFAPPVNVPEHFRAFVTALPRVTQRRLLTQQQLAAPDYLTQGLVLPLMNWLPPQPDAQPVTFSFYPTTVTTALPVPPPVAQPLSMISPVQPGETLLLRPVFFSTLRQQQAEAYQRLLRPVLAELRHAGGNGRWQQHQGVWQLVLNLPAAMQPALWTVHRALRALNTETAVKPVVKANTIVIRQLLAALPQHLVRPTQHVAWMAAWSGNDRTLHNRVAHWLSDFSHRLSTQATPPRLQQGIHVVPCAGADRALLVFIPLTQHDDGALAALRALALMFEPRFFQRLRVEQPIGYVVSARYQRVMDVDGVLLALQSPDIHWRMLLSHCKRFLRAMRQELRTISPETLAHWQQTLSAQCALQDNAEAATEALRRQQGFACLTPQAVAALSLPQMQQLHARLLREHRRWCILVADVSERPPSR